VQTQNIAVTLTVSTAPILTFAAGTPANLKFTYTIGQTASPSLQNALLAFTSGPTGVSVTATPSVTTPVAGTWLGVTQNGGTTPATATVSFNPAGLAVGTYTGNVVISSPGALSILEPVTLTVTAKISEVGVFRTSGGINQFVLDANGNDTFDGTGSGQDLDYINFVTPVAGDVPVVGDWSGTGLTKVGVYRPSTGQWFLDANGNGIYDAGDLTYTFGGQSGDKPVVGDWTGLGKACVGIFRQGFFWVLDANCNGVIDGADQAFPYGGVAGDVPVVGDWTGTGTTKVGVVRPFTTGGTPAFWILDANGNHVIDAGDQIFAFGGIIGDVPVVGDWNGSGTSKAGMYRGAGVAGSQSFFWVIDGNGSATTTLGGNDTFGFAFGGVFGDQPITGKWR